MYAAGLLLVLAAANRFRVRLERRLAAERSRARVDALTNAPNRYALAEALNAEQARIKRGGRTAAVCFLDLDRFKTVNDTYGYAAGDRLLVDVHQRLRDHLRATDLIFRWGGEEFVVLAPHVERAELADFAERLRLLLATRPFAIDGRPRTITGSVGAVLLDEARGRPGCPRGGEPPREEGEADAQHRGRRDGLGRCRVGDLLRSLAPWPPDEDRRNRRSLRRPRGHRRDEPRGDPSRLRLTPASRG